MVPETDEQRRKALSDSKQAGDVEIEMTGYIAGHCQDDFIYVSIGNRSHSDDVEFLPNQAGSGMSCAPPAQGKSQDYLSSFASTEVSSLQISDKSLGIWCKLRWNCAARNLSVWLGPAHQESWEEQQSL